MICLIRSNSGNYFSYTQNGFPANEPNIRAGDGVYGRGTYILTGTNPNWAIIYSNPNNPTDNGHDPNWLIPLNCNTSIAN